MSPEHSAEAAAVKVNEVRATPEERDDVTDVLVQDHKDVVMDKINDTYEEEPNQSDDEKDGSGDDTERLPRGHMCLIRRLLTHSFRCTSASWRSLPRSAATAKRLCSSRRPA